MKADVVFLSESHLNKDKVEALRVKLGFDFFHLVSSDGHCDGLGMVLHVWQAPATPEAKLMEQWPVRRRRDLFRQKKWAAIPPPLSISAGCTVAVVKFLYQMIRT